MIMTKVQNYSGHIGKTSDILSLLNLSSPTIFKKISFEIAEKNASKRWIKINGNNIRILTEKNLELENVKIESLFLGDNVEGEIHITITYMI